MEQEIIKDTESYGGNDEKMSYREIVLKQFAKVVVNSSKEMRSGFWIKSPPSGMYSGGDRLRYVGDAREEYMQSIDVLHDILQPKFDPKMKDKSKEILKAAIPYRIKRKTEGYRVLLIKYRKLFQHICFFLERQAWFITEDTED